MSGGRLARKSAHHKLCCKSAKGGIVSDAALRFSQRVFT
jgi:hypothetical protein